MSNKAPKVPAPSVVEADQDISSNLRVDEQTPQTKGSGPDNSGDATSRAIEGVEIPPSDPVVDQEPGTRRARVAAECWGLRGDAPHDYVVTLDREVRTSGEASALISSLRNSNGYATMFQTSAAGPVRGRRVEFSVDLRTRGATRGANVLLRAEDAHGRTVAFDNMVTSYDADRRPDQLINRGITGDTEWSTQHVVVDIPDEARVITYGVSLFGAGKAWIDNARIEVVSDDLETTAIDIGHSPQPVHGIPINPASLTRSPRNLEFDLEAQAGASPCN
ncbi:MAG TPA: hypothetical protein VGO61_11110 [Steroidobacteraceae bacterium]|nr:hypothetical protein [Steroidobacteraceae bacterium]